MCSLVHENWPGQITKHKCLHAIVKLPNSLVIAQFAISHKFQCDSNYVYQAQIEYYVACPLRQYRRPTIRHQQISVIFVQNTCLIFDILSIKSIQFTNCCCKICTNGHCVSRQNLEVNYEFSATISYLCRAKGLFDEFLVDTFSAPRQWGVKQAPPYYRHLLSLYSFEIKKL